jgi:hypothetical protein
MTVWVYAATQAPVSRGRDCCRFEQAYCAIAGSEDGSGRLGTRHERLDQPIPSLTGSAAARADGRMTTFHREMVWALLTPFLVAVAIGAWRVRGGELGEGFGLLVVGSAGAALISWLTLSE